MKVEITPNSVKIGDRHFEDKIDEVVIRNPAGRDVAFSYPPTQSGDDVDSVSGGRDDNADEFDVERNTPDFRIHEWPDDLPCTD